jgi:hypothetical protein
MATPSHSSSPNSPSIVSISPPNPSKPKTDPTKANKRHKKHHELDHLKNGPPKCEKAIKTFICGSFQAINVDWGNAPDWATDGCYTAKGRKLPTSHLITMYQGISLGFKYITWDRLCIISPSIGVCWQLRFWLVGNQNFEDLAEQVQNFWTGWHTLFAHIANILP